jgi:uncharacterized protein
VKIPLSRADDITISRVSSEELILSRNGRRGIIEVAMTRDEVIATITSRLVDFYHPERIYLFGSAARGDFGPDSDLDFCVVVADDAPEELLRSGEIYSILSNLGFPKDVIPWRRSDFDARAAYVVTSLPAIVVREGRLLYEFGTVAA